MRGLTRLADSEESRERPSPELDLLTVAAAAVLVYAITLIVHELAHALSAMAAGGEVSLISSTDTRGDWSQLSERDVVLVGLSGSAVNALLALIGWLVARRHMGRPTTVTLLAWLFFAVNAWMPVSYLVASPVFDVGDWATIVDAFPNRGPLRASLAATGLFTAGLLWKETVPSLARLVGNGSAVDRRLRAERLVRVAWGAGGSIAVVAALFSPLALSWALPIAAGSTLGTTWPMLPAADRVGQHPVPGAPLSVSRSWTIIVLGAVVGMVLAGVFGPGVDLGG
ncbi:MAG: hypothetical protein R3253_06185 [Longimicrobiales bacterium]|nr:hypothetical protein [Longimicrobiales bacterium]